MATSKSGLIREYVEAKKMASYYTDLEKTLRIQLMEQFFPTAGEGTHITDFKDWGLKCVVRYNYKFDRKALADLEPLFSDKELACVKRNPEFNLTEYRKLSDDEKITIDSTVVITPGLPTLNIEEIYND